MCLTIDNKIQLTFKAPESHIRDHAYHLWENNGKPNQCFWDQAEKECNYILAYKVLVKENTTFHSPVQFCFYWHEGWNVSDRPANLIAHKDVTQAIHVYLNPQDAFAFAKVINNAVVATVHCYKEDFIAAGLSPNLHISPETNQTPSGYPTKPYRAKPYRLIKYKSVIFAQEPPKSAAFTKVFLPKLPQ